MRALILGVGLGLVAAVVPAAGCRVYVAHRGVGVYYDDWVFYPDVYVYYSASYGHYCYRDDHGAWLTVNVLPPHLRLAGASIVLESRHAEPWREFDAHARQYPPGTTARDEAPGHQKQPGESAREYAPGREKAPGQDAREQAPGHDRRPDPPRHDPGPPPGRDPGPPPGKGKGKGKG